MRRRRRKKIPVAVFEAHQPVDQVRGRDGFPLRPDISDLEFHQTQADTKGSVDLSQIFCG